jgi:hypothetical protein
VKDAREGEPRREIVDPLSPQELTVLDALTRGGRTIEEIGTITGERASRTLRALEIREPPLVAREVDRGFGTRVWTITAAGLDARDGAAGGGR